jgi:hypothetical protein
MLVKKTKKGKLSFTLDYVERDNLYSGLISFLENESAILPFRKLKDENSLNRHLHYNVLNDLFTRNHARFTSPLPLQKFFFSRAEALVMILFLKECNTLQLQELKSGLHKLLS